MIYKTDCLSKSAKFHTRNFHDFTAAIANYSTSLYSTWSATMCRGVMVWKHPLLNKNSTVLFKATNRSKFSSTLVEKSQIDWDANIKEWAELLKHAHA